MKKGSIGFSFSAKHPDAIAAAEKSAGMTLDGMSEETKKGVRAVIVRSIREGIPPHEAAKLIRNVIGMNAPQAQGTIGYRASLVASGLAPARVEKSLGIYAKRKIGERAETIARTETLSALNAGAVESWVHAQKAGVLSRAARKKFMTTPDERTCPICKPMNGQAQPFREPFVTPDGRKIHVPPAHPRCRCTVGEPREGRLVKPRLLSLSEILAQGTEFLREGTIIRTDPFPHHSRMSEILFEFQGTRRFGLFKQGDPLRESLATGIGRILNLEVPGLIIPPTGRVSSEAGILMEYVTSTIPLGVISSALAVLKDTPAMAVWPKIADASLFGFSVFDYLVGAADRHAYNFITKLPFEMLSPLRLLEAGGMDQNEWISESRHALSSLFTRPLSLISIDHEDTFYPFADLSFNVLGRYWKDKPGQLFSADARDLWISALSERRDSIFHLVEASGLSLREKTVIRSRFETLLAKLRLNTLGKFFAQVSQL